MSQSPELAGGAGHTFEDRVTARYFAATLAQTGAPGIADRTVTRVALQQRNVGEPLDDLIVDFQSGQDDARLSLQLKRSLTISDADTNEDFRDIVRDCWLTLQKPDFQNDVDRFGAATESVAVQKRRDLNSLCDFARASPTLADFEARFLPEGDASAAVAAIRADIVSLIAKAKTSPPSQDEVYRFLRHFVLLVFDQLADAASGPAEAIAVLVPTLASAQTDRAPLVWDHLCQLARAGAGRAGQFLRRDLVATLTPVVRLAGAPALRGDLELLNTVARSAVADIEDDVEGTRLERTTPRKQLEEARARYRFVQVQGLPGSGKSVLLRHAVEEVLAQGNVLFLKADRLQGTSWAAFAAGIGLSTASLEDLLTELAATGTPTLFIDGIDRIELAQRPIILDLVRTIVATPALEGWSIIATLRDTGVEHLRTWLPRPLFEANILGVVTVEQLDNTESRALADAQPALEPLLFGPKAVREIVRRPFFAKILGQNFASAHGDASFMPQSEIDLIENWWQRGGYNADGQSAISRRLALLDVAGRRARDLGGPIALTDLRQDSVAMIHQLVSDGILQTGRAGLNVRFAHDIFFEWTCFHILLNAGANWTDELQTIGEPPMFGRIVDLLSQAAFAAGEEWVKALQRLESACMRSQWLRAWLLGPIGSPVFDENEARFLAVVIANDCQLLGRVLVWFQAERTIPNPTVLKGETGATDMSFERRLRAADLLGWPSDFATWSRLIQLLLRQCDELPAHVVPQIVAIFEVWQNAFADLPNAISKALLAKADQWLQSLEARTMLRTSRLRSRQASEEEEDCWSGLRTSAKDLASDLRRLILRAGRAEPDLTEAYLRRIAGQKEIDADVVEEIFAFSFLLSQTHPAALVNVALLHLQQELPADAAERIEREQEVARAGRDEALAKPKAERTRHDQLAIDGIFSHIGTDSYSSHDWQSLALDDHRPNYFPESPLREPFHSLFAHAPDESLRLLRELSNHAMTAWRQLHRLDWQREAKPIPLEITFPWGAQQFWGTAREYLWSRGVWAPKSLGCAWLAAENWAFAELDRGANPDSLIRQVVEGNSCIASLGLALTIARQAGAMSDMAQPLVESPRLWRADIRRAQEEFTFKTSTLIGFTREADRPHAAAVDALNKRPIHDGDIRDLAGAIVVGEQARSERMRAAIIRFAEDLQFEFEEQVTDPDARRSLAEFAASMAHWADIANYHAVQQEESNALEAVYFVDPEMMTPEAKARQANARLMLAEQTLFIWAEKSLDSGAIKEMFAYTDALERARQTDSGGRVESDPGSTASGGVAGAAAVALRFREISTVEERAWARDLLARIARAPEQMQPSWFSASVIPWHAGIFAARGLAADLRSGDAAASASNDLLTLAAHPLEGVALVAMESLLSLFDVMPRLAWTGLYLSIDLCILPPRTTAQEDRGEAASASRTQALATALAAMQVNEGWPVPQAPEAPWTFVPGARPSRRGVMVSPGEFDDELVVDGAWRPSPGIWHSQLAAKIIEFIPVVKVLETPGAREALLSFTASMLNWTIESIAPSWDEDGRDADNRGTDLYEWRDAFARLLARIAGHLPPDQVEHDILAPIVALRSDPCFSLLSPLVDWFLRAHVLDPPIVAPSTERVMSVSLERLLAWRGFDRDGYRAGELRGFDLPSLVKALLFVAALNAPLASRFANGDWHDISLILPTVDRLVRAAGWSVAVMSHFLTLCEHARAEYPAEQFADQVLSILLLGDEALAKWHGTTLLARIAGLVQLFADENSPMPVTLAAPLLRILDVLVDQGDRRSAALQLTEAFREVKLP